MADAIHSLCTNPSLFEYLKEEGKKEVDGITWEKVGIIIIIVMVITNIEETITFQMDNLMYFKIKTDSSHFYLLFCYLP